MLNIEIKPLTQVSGSKDITVVDYNVDEATVTVADNKLILSPATPPRAFTASLDRTNLLSATVTVASSTL